MTRNEILEVAGQFYRPETITEREVAFARHMMKYEREMCAKICDDKHDTWRWDDEPDSASGPRDCAAAIRARGEA